MAEKVIDVARQITSEEILEKVEAIDIGNPNDAGGSNNTGSVMAKLNAILTWIKGGTETFTENGTFTVPEGITTVYVTACGGGQGGQNYDGGNAGELIYRKDFTVTPGKVLAITIGAGGKAGADGGATVIGDLITLSGGNSTTVYNNPQTGEPMAGGEQGYSTSAREATSGDGADGINSEGGKGSTAKSGSSSSIYIGGGGSGCYMGKGGDGASTDGGDATPATGYGCGGGGAYYYNKSSAVRYAASAGSPGIVIFEWGNVPVE